MDDAIANAVSAWNRHNAEADMARSRVTRGKVRTADKTPFMTLPNKATDVQSITRKRNMPPPPPGWTTGDTTMAASRTILKQMMGK